MGLIDIQWEYYRTLYNAEVRAAAHCHLMLLFSTTGSQTDADLQMQKGGKPHNIKP